MVLAEELKGSEIAEGLVGTDGIVDGLPVAKGPVEGIHRQVTVVEFIELLGVGALGPFNMAIELARAGK